MSAPLPRGRLEERFCDHKPLYTPAEALAEANRCLYCHDAPCIEACPTHIDIPSFIRKIATGSLAGSARTILSSNLLGTSCARVCPVEVLCVGACVYNHEDVPPIAIGRLQRFAMETMHARAASLLPRRPAIGRKVALVGSGPASLSCAGLLALHGVEATVLERRSVAGGLNMTGIAPYKMPAEDAQREVDLIRALGVTIETGVEVDAPGARTLLDECDAVFLGVGLGQDKRLGVPGEDGPGVAGATAWIERMKLLPGVSLDGVARTIVVGGGNTALDAARELAQLGVRPVTVVYRRSPAEMKGYAHERLSALSEGVTFLFDHVPVAIRRVGEGVVGLVVAPADGPEVELPADLVLVAVGQGRLVELVSALPGVAVDGRGRIVVDPATGRTGHPKVWAGGDCTSGGREVVHAVQDGKLAAQAMLRSFGLDVTLDGPVSSRFPLSTVVAHG